MVIVSSPDHNNQLRVPSARVWTEFFFVDERGECPMWQHCGIHIYVLEHDIYARQAVSSYLSWDRRTRVVGMAASPGEMFEAMTEEHLNVRLDAVTLDAGIAPSAAELGILIEQIHQRFPDAHVICMASHCDVEKMIAARNAGVSAFLSREVVGLGVASAVRFVLNHGFTVTEDVEHAIHELPICNVFVLPGRRHYIRMTPRIEQALWLCVVEGMPADLAADEMGVSVSTVRSYIKEGYRILEAEDDTPYPVSVSPAERAFLRFTALDEEEGLTVEASTPWKPAA
jgi:DNA-binding NarL/FixJ family response regulator